MPAPTSGRQSLRLPQLPRNWAVKYCPHKEGSQNLDPQQRHKPVPCGPSGVRPLRPPRHREGVEVLLPWRVFGAPQPGPPKETRLGRGGFLPPFIPLSLPFYHPLGPRPLRAGLTNSHKTKKVRAGARPNSGGLCPLIKEEL